MGGYFPLGYRVENCNLAIEETEVATVRMIFEQFCAVGSATPLFRALSAEGVCSRGGRLIDEVFVYKLPNNRVSMCSSCYLI